MTERCRSAGCRVLAMTSLGVAALMLFACGGAKQPALRTAPWTPLSALVPSGAGDPKPEIAGLSKDPVLGRVPWFRLTDQDGKSFGLDDLRGKVWIGTFMFTRCRATCPLQSARYVAMQADLGDAAWSKDRKDVRFVSFSVDPENDTPRILRAYAESYQGDLNVWTLLTGERRRIWQLSTRGFHLPAGADPTNEAMPIAHSAMFALVDRRGLIRGYFDSQTDEGIELLTKAIERVVEEPAPEFEIPERPEWLDERVKQQMAASKDWTVRHDFTFRDALWDTGIRFLNRSVDEVVHASKAVHYDHGNGVATADVDGDGHLDLFFVNQVGSNGLFRNRGDGTFEDITKRSGLAMRDAIGVSASFADTDNDGDPDLYVTTVRCGNRFFVNNGKGEFSDQTTAAGLAYVGHSSSAEFFDFDKDGLLDLFVTNVGMYTKDQAQWIVNDSTSVGREPGKFKYLSGVLDAFAGHLKIERHEASLFYRNMGQNKFEDVTRKVGIHDLGWSGDATPLDANGDGWIDLYILSMQGHDEYYENQGGKTFVKRSRETFRKTPWGAMGVKAFDFENDGDFDLYVTDMHSDMTAVQQPDEEKAKSKMAWSESLLQSGGMSIFGNAFYRKTGPGTFEEISDDIGAENYWPWGISVADLNADGFLDVFVTAGMGYPFRYGLNSVLLNDGGKRFLDSEIVLGVEPRPDTLDEPMFELDCAGRDQLDPKCKGKGPVSIVVYAPRTTRSSVIFDVDGDGDLDVVANDLNGAPIVLASDLASKGGLHYLSIALEGTKSNRDGLGAIVKVIVGDRTLTQCHDGQSGYLTQSSGPLYFGLAGAKAADRIEVLWPSGTKQTLPGPIPANQSLTIKEQ